MKSLSIVVKQIITHIEDFFWVETKDADVVPFKLNNMQWALVRHLLYFARTFIDRPLRVIILKGRQFGISTFMLAFLLCKCLVIPNTRAAVISHDLESTKKLFRRIRFFTKMFPIQPETEKESEREYSFPKTNSYIYIGTAGTKAFGRGDNLTDVHCSEVAFWDNAAVIMNGLINAVGKTGNITIETTANGIGDYLHQLWVKSYKQTNSAWYAIFFCWLDFYEYEMDVPVGFVRTAFEQSLVNKFPKLTDRKLQWRRWKISEIVAEPGFTAEQVFQQEYPLTPEEAFIFSGTSVFSQTALDALKPIEPIDIEDGLKIWEYAVPRGYSVMGIDSSEGLESRDRSVIDIYGPQFQQMAQWAGYCDPDELAKKAITFGLRYNSYIVCEINNMGIAVQNILRSSYSKEMQYRREVFDERVKKRVKKLGWRTTKSTKPRMVSDAVEYIRERKADIKCAETIAEMYTFVKDGKGGTAAKEGCNDDRVMAMALALQGYIDRPPERKFLQKDTEAIDESNIAAINAEHKHQRIKRIKQAKRHGYV